MSERFYSHARLYDRLFPGGEPPVDFYKAEADRQGGSVLELGCGTGHKLIPIASEGIRAPAWNSRRTCSPKLSLPMPTAFDAPAMRCRSWIPTVAT